MISDARKAELASNLAAYMERYLDKQWIDSEARESTAEDEEELEFLRTHVSYSVVAHY